MSEDGGAISDSPTRDPNSAQTVEKAMQILQVVGSNSRSVSLRDLVEETGYSTTSVQRILRALEKQGAVNRNEVTLRYQVGWMVRGLHPGHEWHDTLKAIAWPRMLDLRRHVGGMTVGLYVLAAPWQFTCVETCPGTEGLQHIEQRYRPIPMGVGATSLVFLAQLRERYGAARLRQWLKERAHAPARDGDPAADLMARVEETARTGMALTHGTRFPGMAGMSSPIVDDRSRIVAALTVSGIEEAFDATAAENWAPKVRATCQEIARHYASV